MRTAQQVFDEAVLRSVATDPALFANAYREILARIDRAQQELFTQLAEENRFFYVVPGVAVASSNAANGRVLDLSGLAPAVERVLMMKLPSGVEINRVDLQDITAELAPRAYPVGATMVEVGADWSPVPGPVNITLAYVYRPAQLDLTLSNLTQQVTVPDRFVPYLEDDLAWYMASKDFGRGVADPKEQDRLDASKQKTLESFLAFLDHFPGLQSQRFILPKPAPGSKR